MRSSARCAGTGAPRRTALSWTNGSSFLLPAAPSAHDQAIRLLVLVACALAERRHAPGGDRMAAALRLALAAPVGVVDRVHRGAAHSRALAAPPAAARLP